MSFKIPPMCRSSQCVFCYEDVKPPGANKVAKCSADRLANRTHCGRLPPAGATHVPPTNNKRMALYLTFVLRWGPTREDLGTEISASQQAELDH